MFNFELKACFFCFFLLESFLVFVLYPLSLSFIEGLWSAMGFVSALVVGDVYVLKDAVPLVFFSLCPVWAFDRIVERC